MRALTRDDWIVPSPREVASITERAKWAAPFPVGAPHPGDHRLPPGSDSPRAAEGLPIVLDDGVGLVAGDRLHEFVLAGETVVHLRAAEFRRHLDVFQGGRRDPAFMDQGGLLRNLRPGLVLPWR
jgi:hypothetical protein